MPEFPSVDPHGTVKRPPVAESLSTVDRASTSVPVPDATGPYQSVLPHAPQVPGVRITAEIAKGGMGCVYAGVDLTLERDVAVKTLLPGVNAERFIRESKITAQLPHPGIPPVHSLGTLADGTPYLVMKLIRGATLTEILKTRKSPQHDLSQLVQIFEQIAQAVGFAHSQHIIHRDLKPLNIMVGEFGEVQVMDWGLAKQTRSQTSDDDRDQSSIRDENKTATGAVMGTPGYMAPEQARGEQVDARADVFALGAILATILTGKPAFVGNTVQDTISRAARGDTSDVFARLDTSNADFDLVGLAKECLAAEATKRPVDARDVAQAVATYRARVETRLREAETEKAQSLVREAEQRKRRKIQWLLALVVFIAVAGISGLAWWNQRKEVLAERDKLTRLQQQRDQFAAALDAADVELRADRAAVAAETLAQLSSQTSDINAELLLRWNNRKEDAELLQRIDRIEDSLHDMRRYRVPSAIDWPDAALATAFRESGIRVGRESVEVVVERISDSPIRDRIIAGLDLWLAISGNVNDRAAILEVLQKVDPHGTRNRIRVLQHQWVNESTRSEFIQLIHDKRNCSPRFWAAVSLCPDLTLGYDLEILSTAREIYPNDPTILATIALSRSREMAGAVNALRTPSEASDLKSRIASYAAEVVPCYEKALAQVSNRPVMWSNYGATLAINGKLKEAEAALRTAIEKDPKLLQAYTSLTLLKPADILEVLERGTTLITTPTDVAELHRTIGVLLTEKNPEKAKNAFRRVLSIIPNDIVACIKLGTILRLQGDLEQSATILKLVSGEIDRNSELAYATGATAFDRKDYKTALTLFQKATVTDPKSYLAWHMLGRAHFELRDYANADKAQYEAAKIGFLYAPAYLHRAYALAQLDRWKDAATSASGYIMLASNDPTGYEVLADCRIQGGEPAKALQELLELFSKKPAWEQRADLPLRILAARAALVYATQILGDTPLPVSIRAHLRLKAYELLTADLTATAKLCKTNLEQGKVAVHSKQGSLSLYSDFDIVRDAKQLATLPADEQKRWVAFWAAVDKLLNETPTPPGVFRTF